jgi:hypothetical protein
LLFCFTRIKAKTFQNDAGFIFKNKNTNQWYLCVYRNNFFSKLKLLIFYANTKLSIL